MLVGLALNMQIISNATTGNDRNETILIQTYSQLWQEIEAYLNNQERIGSLHDTMKKMYILIFHYTEYIIVCVLLCERKPRKSLCDYFT